jgi:sigma-B regulation protein RsbQ
MRNIIERNNVNVFGKGKSILLFAHGFGCDQTMWRFLTPFFQDDYTIVLFDYVGSGKSDLTFYDIDRYSSFKGYAKDIADVCDALNLQDVIFVGHSVSCMIGVMAHIDRPELFKNLVLIAPSARYINDGAYLGGFEKEDLDGVIDIMEKNYAGWANFIAPVIMKNAEQRPELALELAEKFCINDHTINKRFARLTFYSDSRHELLKVTAPTLILQCSEDAIAPDSAGLFIYENITGSSFIKMQAIGHCPHMSYPEETANHIQEYLKAMQE